MLIGVPKEIKADEYRVGLIPSTIKDLIARGHEVEVETHAGDGAGIGDQEEPNMAKRAVKWLIIASVTIGITTAAWAQDSDLGISLYRLACGVCHGIDGKGNGPLSEQLKVPPADLTVLAKKNNGVFPVSSVYETIDGRKMIAAHGTREMPIWGAYNRDELLDPFYDPEATVRTRILTIIDYLNRIQEK